MKSQSQYVIKGEKLYQNGEIIGNRKIHILDSNKLRVKNGKYVLTSLLLNKLKNKNIRIKKQLFINNQQTSNKYDETLEEEPSKKYTYELSEINTPNVEINTPYVEINTPYVEINTPNVEINTPYVEIETPYVEIDTSTVELHIPNVELHTPNAEIDTPNVEQYTPNVEIDTLKVVIDTNNVISQYSKTSSGGIIYITNIVLNTLCNDTSTSITRDIPFYNAFSFGTYLVLGKTYSLTVTICDINITYPAAIVSVWIDWNQTNSYNENDWIQVSNYIPIGESARVEFVVPMTAKLGTTGMRIRSRGASDGNKNGPKDAYVYMGSGDTQDYPITIVSEEL
uniref:GEVED domain-containing protein n=1 Tax=viral metagenome TaxID=1070528 RepID=A0A6C0CUJ5_9ZZZZ